MPVADLPARSWLAGIWPQTNHHFHAQSGDRHASVVKKDLVEFMVT